MQIKVNLLFLIITLLNSLSVYAEDQYFQLSSLPHLPTGSGYSAQPGLAGAYIGMDNDVLIVAGGANFPGKLPWRGSDKTYHNEIFILKKNKDGDYTWRRTSEKIPFPSAYGGAVETPWGLLCFGGNTADRFLSESWLIDYNPATEDIRIKPGPALPHPLTKFAFAKVDGNIFVAGGLSDPAGASGRHFFKLSITDKAPMLWTWEAIPPWKGESRAFAVGVGQSNGETNCFYLFSGINIKPGNNPEILYDAHVFNPFLNKWSIVSDGADKKFSFPARAAFPVGAATIIFLTEANEDRLKKQMETENYMAQLTENDKIELDSLYIVLFNHLNNHSGFGSQLMAFNTITNTTYSAGQFTELGPGATTAVKRGNEAFIPSGEIFSGVNTPNTLKITINNEISYLKLLDVIVITLYFLSLSWMGWFFSKRQKTTDDYFKGGGRVPWWAAGLSIFGTALSSITFMAIPAKTFATNWTYFMLNMSIVLVAPIVTFLFIPFYRKMNITTAYEYLEVRFNIIVRLIGSLSFIIFQVARMGVVMFLPSIALNVVTGIDIFVCISLMGIVSLIYTMMGGIEAVIWTDAVQVIVLLGGALLALILISFSVDGGIVSIVETAVENKKLKIFDLTWSLRQPTVWVMLFGGIFANITTYGTDQTMVQRYLVTKSENEAKQSVWTNALLAIPAALIFFSLGTALFVFYKTFPQEFNPTFQSNDSIFPWYIASQMPAGISGLLIAGIFAAAMSTLSSSMNSAATAYTTDIHFRFNWHNKVGGLRIARIATLIIGWIGILFALFMATTDIKSLWDEFQKILGLIIGSLGGVFLLGILIKKSNSAGAIFGIICSVAVQILLVSYESVHLLMYSATGVISCFLFGYIGSVLFKTKKPHVD